MPLKTARPSYRIDSHEDVWIVTSYPVVNRVAIPGLSVRIPKDDPDSFKSVVDQLVADTRQKFGRQEN